MSLRKRPGTMLDGFEKTLNAARQGELSQLGVLLDLYRGYLLTVASKRLSHEVKGKAAPSDLVQETLMQACRAFGEFRGSTEFELRAWLSQILARKVIDVHRHYRGFSKRDVSREILLSDIVEEHETVKGTTTNFDSPMELVGQAENARTFEEALETLNEEQRQAIQLRSIDQLSFDKVGELLGKSADSAQKLWARAIRNLTRALESHESGS